ncbi:MAG: hypothetical protein EDM79_10050 [Chloroflexi bacterium]|nr:MAG: hypothetical protein EDM79_10050 [Chloroflexota bacterium]
MEFFVGRDKLLPVGYAIGDDFDSNSHRRFNIRREGKKCAGSVTRFFKAIFGRLITYHGHHFPIWENQVYFISIRQRYACNIDGNPADAARQCAYFT